MYPHCKSEIRPQGTLVQRRLLNFQLLSFMQNSLEFLQILGSDNEYIFLRFYPLVLHHIDLDQMSCSLSILLWPILLGIWLILNQICTEDPDIRRLRTEVPLHSCFEIYPSTWNLLDHQGTKAIQFALIKTPVHTYMLSSLSPSKVASSKIQIGHLQEFHRKCQFLHFMPRKLCIRWFLLLWWPDLALWIEKPYRDRILPEREPRLLQLVAKSAFS